MCRRAGLEMGGRLDAAGLKRIAFEAVKFIRPTMHVVFNDQGVEAVAMVGNVLIGHTGNVVLDCVCVTFMNVSIS